MLLGKAYILVHIECYHILEANQALVVKVDKLAVCAKGCTTGGKTKNKGFLRCRLELIDFTCYIRCSPAR